MRISDWSSDVCSSDLAGARARASSIHVNAWFGDYDKATMAAELLADDLGIDPQEQSRRVLFIGDAPNDESLFRACALSVGVANIKPHLNNFAHHPRWVCDAGHGAGFVEKIGRARGWGRVCWSG